MDVVLFSHKHIPILHLVIGYYISVLFA